MQTSLLPEEPVQEKCETTAQQHQVQTKCADCEKKEKEAAGTGTPVQQKCDKCAAEDKVTVQQSAIQRKGGIELPVIPDATEKQEESPVEKPKVEGEEGADKKAAADTSEKGEEGADLPVPPQEPLPEPEIPEPIQAKKAEGNSSSAGIENSLQSSKGGGSTMDPATNQSMSSGFGTDFSHVRIHTDSNAVQMNKELGSHAFTNGSDIYFNSGKYDPDSDSGKHLLAHELTHTVQQGASNTNEVQRFTPPGKTVTPEPSPEKPNDGSVMEGNANAKIDNEENVQNQDDLDEEEAKEKKNPPRDEVRSEKASVQSEGVTDPPVDRGGQAQTKIGEQKQQMNEKLAEAPPQGEGKGEGKDGKEAKPAPGSAAEGKQQAEQAKQAAHAVEIPATPQPFKQPNVIAPLDSAGEPLPRQANIDTQVRGLGYIGEMLRVKGYELKKSAAEKTIYTYGLDEVLGKQREDLANANEGTQKIEDHNTARKDVSKTSKEVLDDSKERQAFVAQEAPTLAGEADGGKADSGGLASEASSKSAQSQSEIPDDPDARADAEQQSAEMQQTADGAKSMDDAVNQTGERARQYIADAEQASKDNQGSEGKIQETDGVIAQIDGRVAEMKAKNEESNTKIQAVSGGPELLRQHAQRTAQTGEELIAATIVMEAELNSLQDEYLAGMAAIESKEAAEERIKKEQENQPPPSVSPEEQQLFALAGMSEAEQEQQIGQMTEPEKQGLMAALEKMIKQTPDNGTDATEGARQEVKLGSLTGEAPPDPRQEAIAAVDNQRVSRLSGVLDVADQNMNYLSEEQQQMLAEKLVGESITDDIKNISILQIGKGMIEGMLDPRVALQGVVDGFGKTLTGIVNIFNAEAWAKDPLGNLLQIGADISTGLAMIFSSILGVAAMITALMVALIIISWGFATPVAGPVIGWMGTVMTYAGWGAIIAGSLSVLFNSLAYIKNLNDAGTASTARELFGNTEQMKQNATDGFTGAMSIVEGVGAVKMGPVMKSGNFINNIPKSPGAFARQTLDGMKDGLGSVKALPGNIVKGAKKLFASGKKGMLELKDRFKRFFSRSSRVDVDAPNAPTMKKTKLDGTPLDDFQGQKVQVESEFPDGHRGKVLDDGQCTICSSCEKIRSKYKDELKANPEMEAELKGYEDRLRANPNDTDALAGQKRIHDELSQDSVQRTGKSIKDMEDRIARGDRTITKEEYKKFEQDKRIQQKNMEEIRKRYERLNPEGGLTDAEIKKKIEDGKRLNEETGRFGDPDPNVSKRKEYMGATPRKDSDIGTYVKQKMEKAGFYDPGPPEMFKSLADNKWYDIELADMSHKPKNMGEFPPHGKKPGSAVEYWNEEGKFKGAKSKEVRDFMNDKDNYYLEHKSHNRSDGAKMGMTYDAPVN